MTPISTTCSCRELLRPQSFQKSRRYRGVQSIQRIVCSSDGRKEALSRSFMNIVAGGLSSVLVVAASPCLPLPGITEAAFAAECPEYVTASSGDAKGLQFCDIAVGDGDSPVKGSFIKVHYEGRLDSDSASGTFDSSYDRRRPLGFSIGTGQVIRGWDLGILGDNGDIPAMKAGGKRKLVIPAELGYGARGAGGVIPPNATLYFDVEYLGRLGQKK